jgi:hypothetical protein
VTAVDRAAAHVIVWAGTIVAIAGHALLLAWLLSL